MTEKQKKFVEAQSKNLFEEEFKNNTVGLTTKEEFIRKKEHIHDLVKETIQKQELKQKERIAQLKRKRQQTLKQYIFIRKQKSLLSFEQQQEQQSQKREQPQKRKVIKYGKNPNIKTSFLPDRNKEQQIRQIKKQLKDEFHKQSQKAKEQIIQLSFCYWDSPNLTKKVRAKKKEKILGALEACRLELMDTYQFMAKLSAEDLMFIVKDVILPHNMTFFQAQSFNFKTRFGEPIFNWKQIKVQKQGKQQLNVFIDLNPACKIIDKVKYQKSRHLNPCCNWQQIDMTKLKLK